MQKRLMMKIEYNGKKISFEKLRQGDVFAYENLIYMKTECIRRHRDSDAMDFVNAVNIENGDLIDFMNEYVEPIKGKFIMEK